MLLPLGGYASDVFMHVPHRSYLPSNAFWNLHAQCLFQRDDQINCIQRIEAEILSHSSLGMEARAFKLKLVHQSLIDYFDRLLGGEWLRH